MSINFAVAPVVGPLDTIVHADEDSPFEAMLARYERAASLLHLEPGIDRILRHAEKEITIAVPI